MYNGKMIQFKIATLLCVLSCLAFMFSPYVPKARAWSYWCKWPSNSTNYDAHTLSSGWANAVSFGRNQWINVTPSPFDIFRNDTSNNDVTLGTTPAGTTAITVQSCSGGILSASDITFNNTLLWYTGSGSPGSSFDARSTATHEFGHHIGLNDTQSTYCPADNSLKATMCIGGYSGTTFKRTLESDDRNVINAVYP